MKKLLSILIAILFTTNYAMAQRTISGIVTSNGEPIIGASVVV